MTTLLRDLRFGLRLLLKRPGFTFVTVLTLALGIGANTAIFSVVNGVLLGAVPFAEPGRLIYVGEHSEQVPGMSVSYPNFLDWVERNRSFEALAAHRYDDFNLTGFDQPELLTVAQVSATLLPILRVEPIEGRNFTAEEDQVGSERVVMIGYDFWHRRLGADPDVLERSLTLDGEPYRIVGVLPKGFIYPLSTRGVELWMPIGHFAQRWLEQRGNHPGIYVTGRLLPEVAFEQARADMERIAAELAAEYPDTNAKNGVSVSFLQDRVVRDLRPALVVLTIAVALVLLIACVNVANLLLVRSSGRHQEMAIRTALGAGRWQVTRQLLGESLALSLLGGAFGLVAAVGGVRLLLARIDPDSLPASARIAIDGKVLLFTLGVSLLTGLLFGLAPAFHTLRRELVGSLKEGAKGSGGRERHRLRSALVVAEISLALVILVGAVLFLQSLGRLTRADPGFDPANVLTFDVELPVSAYPEPAEQTAFFDQLLTRLEALPGVHAAAVTLPLLGGWQNSVRAEGQPEPAPGEQVSTDILRVSPGYLETMGVTLLRGRFLNDQDRADTVPVGVIDTTFAERFWPGEEPLGKRVRFGDDTDPWIEVVGVVNHVKSYGVNEDSRIEIYVPARQSQLPFTSVVLKTADDPRRLVPLVEQEVRGLDRNQPIANVATMDELLAVSTTAPRLAASLLTVFAALAVLLAAVGIYGVMAYAVSQRRREIGIRMAMGAASSDILRLVVRQGMALAGLGVGIGLALALVLGPFVAGQLYGIGPRDPATLASLTALLALVALAACTAPARRASRVEPVTALHYE